MMHTWLRRMIIAMAWLTSSFGWSQKSVYSFGGSCVSQGSWTQAALQQTQSMIEAMTALSSDPNCAGLQQSVMGLREMQNNLESNSADADKAERFEAIPKNLDALQAAATGARGSEATALEEVAMNETLEGAGLALSTVGDLAKSASTATGAAGAAAATVLTLGQKTRQAAIRGLEIFDRLTQALPTFEKCAQKSANQAQFGTLIAGAIQLGGAYAGSVNGMHSILANSIGRLVTMLQQKPFAEAIGTLNEIQYRLSMSCLLETTAEKFCSADDARKILRLQVKELAASRNNQQSPLEGLYLLARDIPNIAAWLKRVQFGFMPRLTSDADFKNKVVQNYNSLLMNYYSIRGKFSEDLSYYRSLPDLQSRQTMLFNMLQDMVNQLGGGRVFRGGSDQNINFFTMVQIAEMIPFYLIGRREIPTAVAANNDGRMVMAWDQWMKGTGGFENAPEFKTPDALVIVMEKQLDALLDEASRRASIYLMNFLIVDNPNLVSETVADQNLTVMESFRRIYRFLDRLDKKIMSDAGAAATDPLSGNFRSDLLAMRPVVAETKEKLKLLIEAMGRLMVHSAKSAADLQITTDDYRGQANQLYKEVITTAFTEFNVQFQRETMLAVRMGNFVRADFANKIRYRQNMTPEERNLLISYGRELIDRVTQSSGYNGDFLNPAQVEVDLDTAQTVNLRNLVAFEQLFKDQLYQSIQELNKMVNVGASEAAYRNSLQEAKERYRRLPSYSPAEFYFWKWAPQLDAWSVRRVNGFRYESFFKDIMGADDVEGSLAKFKARLCIQTLAFQDKARYRDICRGSEIKSIFSELAPDQGLSANYDALYREFTHEDRPLLSKVIGWRGTHGNDANKVGKNVCAWRDYNRRNLVFWLTKKNRPADE